ncbi:hypothetical protein [Nocardiopsis dassonvillei]|uniref:Uncharacterized protein n=1 Tax=Nocardiopsis dassonvillei (strain ATCC 23218 / DSM 43111 / CIP 107115 / JCM 7437 / KCTC 9190 / NBRC 14626 / NCTC 10488 / NRRL B-5397 / IMRU 509) TaxID=446468 RepID=D7B8B1_NOCDD|nr:hypothetical protein [Nocardiopsis dassonvillei]ADH70419.1 hypothetical protein Ndas_5038 [Nocardiopsis dassonvillei subsp. dassonvillei DSM 43111]NKY77049.1 hypothetical protein [Nocardiopsis dassonvillei]VEI91328.1 Uncharacterised protein [Nocardiopsis dassonvillei]
MRQFSAALLSRALGPLIAFLSAPCGRHSTVAGRRRRRSTRVRRYLPEAPHVSASEPAMPRLAPAREVIPAEDVALVRPYFAAHERLTASAAPRVPAPRSAEPAPETDEVRRAFALVQERAAALVQQWRDDPGGDLLGEPAPRFGVVRPAGPAHPTALTDRTTPTRYAEWDELASLIRVWDEQRQGVPA